MSVTGVGPITVLVFRATTDDPARFAKSRAVGAHLRLTPGRHQSGETDIVGKKVGLMCTIGPSRLIDLFGAFHQRYEGVQLFMKDGAAAVLEDMLTAGELDVAIYCRPEELSEALHALPLYRERFVVACAPGHRLARLEAVRLRDLEGESYLSRVNCEYRDVIREIREGMGISIKLPHVSERDDWIQCMVMAGLGFTLIPEYPVTVPGLVTRPLSEPEVLRSVNLVTVRGRPHSPAVGAFVHESRRYPWAEKLRGAVPPTTESTSAAAAPVFAG